MEKYYECEVHNVEISIKINGITKVISAREGKALPIKQTSDYIKINIKSIKDFEIVALS